MEAITLPSHAAVVSLLLLRKRGADLPEPPGDSEPGPSWSTKWGSAFSFLNACLRSAVEHVAGAAGRKQKMDFKMLAVGGRKQIKQCSMFKVTDGKPFS